MLVCRAIDADVIAGGASCCRLSGFHRRPRSRRACYSSDTSDAQWRLIDPLLPDPRSLVCRTGRREEWCRRDVVDAIFYLVDNGAKWRNLPRDFPPWQTVYRCLAAWEKAGVTQRVLDGLRDQERLRVGRLAEPSAAIIDSQTVKAAEEADRATRGFDAGKKINGRKRHLAVDTLGLLLTVLVTAADAQDRDGAKPLLQKLAGHCRRIRLIWADGGYTGKLIDWVRDTFGVALTIVKRNHDTTGFEVLPRRWVVERTLAWITRHRRCARDYERLPEHHETMVRWTQIRLISKRIATNRF